MIKLNIWIDIAKQFYNTKNNTLPRGMRLGEMSIHVAVTVKTRNKHMKDSRNKTYQLIADNHRKMLPLKPTKGNPCKGAIY